MRATSTLSNQARELGLRRVPAFALSFSSHAALTPGLPPNQILTTPAPVQTAAWILDTSTTPAASASSTTPVLNKQTLTYHEPQYKMSHPRRWGHPLRAAGLLSLAAISRIGEVQPRAVAHERHTPWRGRGRTRTAPGAAFNFPSCSACPSLGLRPFPYLSIRELMPPGQVASRLKLH
jgi:hypothetical protein